MRRWRIGTEPGLRALTRDDVAAYFERYYKPSNIILSIVGQFDRDAMIAEVIRLYGGSAESSEVKPVDRDVSPSEPQQTSTRFAFQKGPIEETRVSLGFHTPGILAPEAHALEVLAAILSSGRASRFNQYLRDQQGLVTSASASSDAFENLGYFEIGITTEKPLDAQIAALAELESIRKYGVSDEAIARAKAVIAQEFLAQLETVDGTAKNLALSQALGDWKRSDTYLEEIGKVTAAQVIDVARKYLTDSNLSVFVYVPEGIGSSLRVPQSVQDLRSMVLAKVADATPRHQETELPVDAKMPVIASSIMVESVKPVEKRSILRGPDVYIVEDRSLPLVSFGIFYPGGRLSETAENSGITELMLRSALRGTTRYSSAEIARRLENSGAQIQVYNDPDFFGYVLSGLGGKMNQALEVLINVLQQPRFDPEGLEREKTLQLSRIRNLREDNYAYPVRLFLQTLFGEHPYSRPGIGTAESVARLKVDDVRKWFEDNERKTKPLIVIAGDSNGTALVAPLAERLTNVDLVDREISRMPVANPARVKGETVQSISRQQTAMVYGSSGATLNNADRFALIVFQNIVSGLGGRFFDVIRDKQGLAYTVSTSNAFFTRGGAVYTYSAFSPENEAAVRTSLEQEIENIRKNGVTPEELRKAVAFSIGDHEMDMQSRDSTVLEYARAVYSGAGVASVTKYSDSISKVTAEQIQAAAEKYFNPAGIRVAVIRGEKKN